MSTINSIYINALLADATYADDLVDGLKGRPLRDALAKRMTDTLAKFISNNFEVVAHKESGDTVESGFDATVWRGIAGPYANQIYVSMQGTSGLQDFITDANLALPLGSARAQFVDMVNWWNQITTSGEAQQIQQVTVPGSFGLAKFFAPADPVQGSGLLANATSVHVNGHSLGGHLAAAFARLYGDRSGGVSIDGVTTFNSAGFAPGSELAFLELERAMGTGSTTFKGSKQANIFAQNGLNVTTNTFYFEQIGRRISLFNEESTGLPNHYMYKLTDALSLGVVMTKLDPSLTLEQINSIFSASSNQTAKSLETTLDALRRIAYGQDVAPTSIGDVDKDAPSRTDFHFRLEALSTSDELTKFANAGTARIRDLTPFDGNTINTTAQSGAESLAYRYALKEMNSFAVIGIDYTNFNQNNELTLWSEANPSGTLTREWIKDRAAFLAWKLKANIADVTGSIRNNRSTASTEYNDTASNETLLVKGQLLGTDSGAFAEKVGFGGTGNDTLEGGDKVDHLYGGTGVDTLNGGKGDDYLEGGGDSDGSEDTYIFAGGDGKDTILDVDGKGHLKFGSTDMSFKAYRDSKPGQDLFFADSTANVRFEFMAVTPGATCGELILTRLNNDSVLTESDRITIKNFDLTKAKSEEGYLGIKLDDRKQIALTDNLKLTPAEVIALGVGQNLKKLKEGASETVKYVSNFVAQHGETIRLFMPPPLNSLIKLVTGDETLSFNDQGYIDIEIGAGVSERYFSLLSSGDADQDLASQLKVTLLDATGQPAKNENGQEISNSVNIELDATVEDDSTNHVINGDGSANDPNDVLSARDNGDYTIDGKTGINQIFGKGGNDELFNAGSSAKQVGAGQIGAITAALANGAAGDDTLFAGQFGENIDEVINAGASIAGSTADYVDGAMLGGGAGDDRIIGDQNNDFLLGGEGDDLIAGGGGSDLIYGDQLDVADGAESFGYESSRLTNADNSEYVKIQFGEGIVEHAERATSGGSDTIHAGGGNDFVYGDGGNDTIYGEDGNDSIRGGQGDDTILGGKGDDTLFGEMEKIDGAAVLTGSDFIDGGDGNDRIEGNAGNDVLFGGDGNDQIYGGDGDDYIDGEGNTFVEDVTSSTAQKLFGGAGDDTIIAGDSGGAMRGDGGVETASHGNDTLYGGAGVDVAWGDGGNDTLFGGAGDDQLEGDGDDLGGALQGNDYVDGEAGKDNIRGGGGNDKLYGGSEDDTIEGDAALTSLEGSFHGEDEIDGEDGNDTLIGGGKADTISGGIGNDRIFGDIDLDGATTEFDGDDKIEAGAGNDVVFGNGGNDTIKGEDGDDVVMGGDGDDDIDGGDGDDTMFGGAGDDTLDGGDGANFVDGGEGNDLIIVGTSGRYEGGEGDDTYVVQNAESIALIGDSLGENRVLLAAGDGTGDVSELQLATVYVRSGTAQSPYGWQVGQSQSDVPGGQKQIAITSGHQTVIVNDAFRNGGLMIETANGGTVRLDQLISNFYNENVSLAGGSQDEVIATGRGADAISGGIGDDSISTGAGNDTIDGGEGSDYLNGGTGADQLTGGSGDDYYSIDDVNDVVVEAADGGTDTVYSDIDLVLGTNVENLYLNGESDHIGTGNELANVIGGGEGRNTLYGMGGNDTLTGGQQGDTLEGGEGDDQLLGLDGNDTYVFGSEGGADTVNDWVGDNILRFKEGISLQDIQSKFVNANGDITIDYASGASVTVVGSENGGFSQVKFADGTTMSRSEFLGATLQNNLMVGTAGNDGLVGTGVDDLVFGSSGDDGLSGLGGNDTISGEGGSDILAGGDGNDVLSGGEGDDFIDGGAGNNIIESGAGNDVMVGGDGNDIYVAGSLGEVGFKQIVDTGGHNVLRFGEGVSIADLSSVRGEGDDVVVSIGSSFSTITISDGLSGSISNFQFADGSSIGYSDFLSQTWAGGDLIGTSADDDLRGGTGNESLSGLEGDDRLSGGAGDDALSGGEGRDTLEGGEGNDFLSGDSEDDSLRGGGGNDELHGGDGRDQMDGGSGDDELSGDNDVDTYVLNAGGGQDVIVGETGANKILLGGSAGLTSVRARTEGADVLVWRPTTGDSMRLTGYRDGGQSWQIDSADGHSITLEDLLVATATGNAGDGSTASKIATYRDIFAEKQLLSNSDGLSGLTLSEGSSAFSYADRNGSRTDYQLGITRRNLTGDDQQIVADGAEEYSSVVTSQTSETRTTYSSSYETTTNTEPTVKLVPLDPSRFADSGIVGLSGTVSGGYLVVNGKPKVTTTTTVVKTPHVEVIDHVNRSVTNTATIDSVQAGASNNTVQTSGAGKLVDTGAGNDTVLDANSQPDPGHASHNDSNTDRYGDFLYGNAGDDALNGRDLRDELIGGAGSDTMDGGKGADTYRIFADEDGRDLVLDSGANPLRVSIHLNAVVDGEGPGLVWSQVLDIVGDLPRTEGALNAVVSLGLREDPYHPGTFVLDQPDFNSPDYYDQVQGLPARIVTALAPFFPGLQDRFDQMVAEGQGQVQIDANGNIQAGFHIDTDFTSPAAEGLTLSNVEDVVSFEAGIDRSALVVNWTNVNNNGEDHAALEIRWGGSGSVRVLVPQANDPSGLGIEKFQFADGTSMSMGEMLTLANWVPTVETPLVDQTTAEGMDFEYVVPQELFHDADAGQALTVSATVSDGEALPSWLTFDVQTGKFSGLVPGNASGTLEVKVTATDPHGAKASDVFTIAIADVNRAPVVASSIDSIDATQDQALSFTVPDGAFADPDGGDVLTYAATLANGDPLPDWLSFDADTRTFTGTPGSGDVRDMDVKVIATDTGGQSVFQSFSIAVANVNDAPVVMSPIAEQTASEDAQFHFTVPVDAFHDVDADDSLTFTAKLENGDDLPAWLTFDAGTQTFSGTPVAGDIGALVVKLSVQDAAGLSTSQSFRLNVADVNHAPGTGESLPAQTASEDAAFSYTLPASAFADADTGDALSLTAKLANGDALPSWLTFDTATQTFAGTPANGDVGQLDLVITAADAAGLTATQTLHLNVANVNDAPEAIGVIVAPGATENTAYTFAIPSGSFADVDAGDSLRYTAKLANGDALPSWLSLTTGLDGALRLTGTPPKSSPDALDIVLTATDLAGASASSSFALAIAHAPQDPGVVLTGTRRSDTLTGGSGSDTLSGGGGNDTLNGMGGSDTLNGDAGADTLNGGDDGDLLFGNGGADTLNGDAGNDQLHGGLGADVLNGGADNDLLFGDEGLDQLFGGSGSDYLNGGTGADALDGGEGNDVLEGAQGVDVITDLQGNNLLSGNQGSDQLTGGNGNNVFIGGLNNDTIVSGSGNDLFAFNALDGDDHIRLGGGEDTLSLGGGIRYEDLSLMKQGDSLRLNLGNGDTITFDDWYTSPANQSLVNLQVIADSLGDYNASGANVLKDNRVESFDFQALVGKFEEARAANPRLNRWSMMNSMLGAHLGGSDVAAMGGDLAYQYGHAGSLANVSVDAAQAMLASAQLNVDPQALQSVAALQTGGQRLM